MTVAQLFYKNLRIHSPGTLMKKAFYELGTFYEFLKRTKEYMESDAAVKRLAWKPGVPPECEVSDSTQGAWIQLEEPNDRPNEPESTFKEFMDENVREVYEQLDDEREDSGDSRRNGRRKFDFDRKIPILDRDPENWQLLLDRLPEGKQLLLRPNTLTLCRQIEALRTLQDRPLSNHVPLLMLTESLEHAYWLHVEPISIENDEWMVLNDTKRPGTEEQRSFVKIALATPDFAFLEGPPGSGKTTAICELILQLARKGKRVLLCASTHVAVDNVLERLMDERNPHRDIVIPVRIGEKRNISEKAKPWQLDLFVRTERERLLRHLQGEFNLTESQRALYNAIKDNTTSIERMVLDAANLVCGTTIGILQHPDIKANGHTAATFDVLIVDEASKTTFQEFLVPALLAKRWVIVGDPKQLSPYVEDEAMAANIEACLGDEVIRNACIDIYMAGHGTCKKRRVTAVASETERSLKVYAAQANAREVILTDAKNDKELWKAAVVVGTHSDLERRTEELPLDIATVRCKGNHLQVLRRRAEAWLRILGRSREEQPEWAAEVAWRIIRLYEQRFAMEDNETNERKQFSNGQRLRKQIEDLLPDDSTGIRTEAVWNEIDRVRRVALPSILESLRHGFERTPGAKKGTALSDGFPEQALRTRHVLLSTQHRMHPDIAKFSHEQIYEGQALHTPEYMTEERKWSFDRFAHRAIWLDVRGAFNGRFNYNSKEAQVVLNELKMFDGWARRNPRKDGHPWEAAVLTFYRGQEKEIRKQLQNWTKLCSKRHFPRGFRYSPYLTIELCTVDRFQGHEADFVVISIANEHMTSFLESPNRLNVALTRARFQRVVVGNRIAMSKAEHSILGLLARNEHWDSKFEGGYK